MRFKQNMTLKKLLSQRESSRLVRNDVASRCYREIRVQFANVIEEVGVFRVPDI